MARRVTGNITPIERTPGFTPVSGTEPESEFQAVSGPNAQQYEAPTPTHEQPKKLAEAAPPETTPADPEKEFVTEQEAHTGNFVEQVPSLPPPQMPDYQSTIGQIDISILDEIFGVEKRDTDFHMGEGHDIWQANIPDGVGGEQEYQSVLSQMADKNVNPEPRKQVRMNPEGGYDISRTSFDLAEDMLGKHQASHANVLGSFFEKYAGTTIDPRRTPWCAAFANAILGKQGLEGTGKLTARSFLNWGEKTDSPTQGDVVVFWRGDPNGWQGHVGFFAGFDDNGNVKVLGGNQSNQVSIQTYSRERLLGFRRAPNLDNPTPGERRLITASVN